MVFKKAILVLLLQHIVLAQHSLDTDKTSLLDFKRTMYDPKSVLANWEEATHVCNFTGVRCDHRSQHRVVQLMLRETDIGGLLSPFIANLTGLRILHLTGNHLYGLIPLEFGFLQKLHYLWLDGNNLQGRIPNSFSHLSMLISIRLGENNLEGQIPSSIFSNCTTLQYVDLSNNNLTGEIPTEIGIPTDIWCLNLFLNSLIGKLPIALSNLSSLTLLDVENNFLSGELPSKIVEKLPKLKYLHLAYNDMVSHDHNSNLEPFFTSLMNCTDLKELELMHLGIGGILPNSIGQLGTKLSKLHLEDNMIIGSIPPNVAKLSNLTWLDLSKNRLNGVIPEVFGQMENLEQLSLSNNFLTGAIPDTLGWITSLGLLDLSNNKLKGEIPISLWNLSRLSILFLNNNLLSGVIPPNISQCKVLLKLDLSYNNLTGRIPREIIGLSEIRLFLNLSHNFLQGDLPFEISKMVSVQEIDLSANNFTGKIFPQLSSCIALKLINLSHNSLEGQLPASLCELRNLEELDVSNNYLHGEIPASLSECPSLTRLNLSFNDFNGSIPTGGIFNSITNLSLLGNLRLCGLVPGIHICHKKRHWVGSHMTLITVSTIISVLALMSTIFCVIGFRCIKVSISSKKDELFIYSIPRLRSKFPRITYRELSEATGGFDRERLIGSGSYGHVYKGVLGNTTVVAIKVLQLQTNNSTKSFNKECEVLKNIRHRNLMRIITACSSPDFKAIVLPYMENRSLESCLYPQPTTGLGSGSSDLALNLRVNICSDIAEGMAYLHHHSPIRIIHCDLKPSNVLLNDDMTALISDFGIAKLMTTGVGNVGVDNMGNSTTNMLHGSIGYIAPEYGFGSSTSTKGDVYSFGVIVLEMVTRKRPTDDMFVGDLNLHKWVKSHYHGTVAKVIDSSLMRAARDQDPEVKKMWEIAIAELIELGLLCTQEAPSTRPSMLDAADDLDRLKRYLNGDTTATFPSSFGISSSVGEDL